MKKIVLFICAALILLLASCSTTVAFNSLVPAKVDVSGYKTIAICSATSDVNPYRYSFKDSYIPIRAEVDIKFHDYVKIRSLITISTSENITKHTTSRVLKAMDTGFFNILEPTITDGLVALGKKTGTVRNVLMQNNVDAILSPKIANVYYDEYITAEKDKYPTKDASGVEYYKTNFYLVQKYSVSISYVLTDVDNNVVIAYDTKGASDEQITKIGSTNVKNEFEKTYYYADTATELINDMIDNLTADITNALSPHYEMQLFTLMKNSPKAKNVEQAYKMVNQGSYQAALRVFENEYKKSGHVPSGYNAAILYYVLGDYDNALSLSEDVFSRSGNPKAVTLYYKMLEVMQNQEAANAQISSTEKKVFDSSSDLVGF
ncbi:MAG: hypothetical protein HUK23_02520 [Sphaerochaetaceae bacterium]|nr:hypothetical protein [Sphaerochaetaceae bacterium]